MCLTAIVFLAKCSYFFFSFDIHSYDVYFISIRVLFGVESWKESLGIMFCKLVGAAEGGDCKIFRKLRQLSRLETAFTAELKIIFEVSSKLSKYLTEEAAQFCFLIKIVLKTVH